MYEVLRLKFTQHETLKRELLGTGNIELIMVRVLHTSESDCSPTSDCAWPPQNSSTDAFWGSGPDGKGRNELGKALMRLRATLRDIEAQTLMQQKGSGKAGHAK